MGGSSGESPFEPTIRVHPGNGVVLETVLTYLRGGQFVKSVVDINHGLVDGDEVLPGNGNAVRSAFGDPGAYVAVVRRTGITSAGLTFLEKRFNFTVKVKPKAPPPGPVHQPLPAGGLVTCSVEQAADPGFGGTTNMRIFGGGFVSGEVVVLIDERTEIIESPTADQFGNYEAIKGYLDTSPPTKHTAQARGQTSGRLSNTAGFSL